jgi:NAD(P)-dependent dehydrogenase (short-subunit alcohol dehydrogenase family)
MSGRLENQVAWITGGASGMGEATAKLFVREGASVAVADFNEQHGNRVVDEIARDAKGKAFFSKCDVSKEDQVKRSIDDTVARFGSLQMIVNCAGIAHVKTLEEYSEAEWDQLMGVNVKSIFFATKHGMRHLRANDRSYMVNIGSVSSFVGQRGTPSYTTSKGAVLQLSRSIALDYAADGLRCNCICPGITDTPLLRYHMRGEKDYETTLAERVRRVPMGVPLTPHDIARNVLFFCTEDSAGVTGTSLVVDGGYLAAAEWETEGRTKFMDANRSSQSNSANMSS